MKINNSQNQLKQIGKQLLRLRLPLFLVLVAAVYLFIILRIGALKNATPNPNQAALASHTMPASPHIDQATVGKIRQLQDNSISVQALFNQARQNPFQE
jgi:hypothetical protein